MDVCLYIGRRNNEWVWELFPGKSPGELTIAGKNWVRYSLDLCADLKAANVHIADSFFYDDLRNRLGAGSFWSTNIRFLPTSDAACPAELLARHRDSLPQDDVLFFWGQVLPDLPDIQRLFDDLHPVEQRPGKVLEDGIYLLRGRTLMRCNAPLLHMDSLQKYFQLNFRMLNQPGMYVLPGYDPAHDNVSFGENVIMMPNCSITPPAVIRTNSCLGRSVRLFGNVIIGESSLIESHSTLKNAIIMDHTCVGRNLAIENKIVCGNRVIDAETAEYVDLTDKFLSQSVKKRKFDRYSVAEFIFALALTIGLAPMFLLALVLGRGAKKLSFFRFLLRIYPQCPRVLTGNAQLVRLGISDQPWVFRLADAYLSFRDPHQRDMADVLYFNHKSVRRMLGVIVLSLAKRLVVISLPDDDD